MNCSCGGTLIEHHEGIDNRFRTPHDSTSHVCDACGDEWQDPIYCGTCRKVIERSKAIGQYGYCSEGCQAEEVG